MPGTSESSPALSPSASGNGNLQSGHGDSGLSFPATQKANVGRSQAQSLPGPQMEFKAYLGNLVKPHLKIKTQKSREGVSGDAV